MRPGRPAFCRRPDNGIRIANLAYVKHCVMLQWIHYFREEGWTLELMSLLDEKRMARLRCDACGRKQMHRTRIDYSYEISHDGRTPVTIRIPDLEVVECGNPDCDRGNPDHSLLLDDVATDRITIETYRQLGLLTPDEIRAGREKLGLNQQELQTLLGLGGNSLSRWENARVYQSRAMDTLLRLVFEHAGTVKFVRRLRGEATPARTRRAMSR